MRDTDTVKALAVEIKTVGFVEEPSTKTKTASWLLYSPVFGEAGISRSIQILKHELETTMALLGITSMGSLIPPM
jgi:L-lactate dehydrogenase (cytochrome)